MPLDAICLTALVEELREKLVGGKIDKVYQPSREEVLLHIRGAGENVKLLLSGSPSGPRLHLTKLPRENPAQPPMFCMLLRKHLVGGRILAMEQPDYERIVLIRLEVIDDLGDRVPRTLVLEALGRRANVLLLDAEDRIIDCLRRIDGDLATGARAVLPGLFYHLPEPRPGLSPLIQRELAFRAGVDSLPDLSVEEKLSQVAELTAEGYRPTMMLREGKSVDFSFLPILQYGADTELKAYPSFSLMLDDYYASRETRERMGQKGQELLKSVTRLRDRALRRTNQQRLELEATKDRERKRELGDLLTSNLHLMTKGMKSISVLDFYDPEGKEIAISLDPLKTPQQNAAKYYKEYTKSKTAEGILIQQIEKGIQEQAYLESVLQAIQLAEGERDLAEIRTELSEANFLRKGNKQANRTMKVQTKPMEFRSTAGLRISVGKNNTQNDKLTTKLAGRSDIWLHTQKIHGSHVILWTEGEAPDAQSLTEAAQLAAWFSQARDSKKVPVDYTPVKLVKKPAGARPGMVIYNSYQTAYVDPDGELVKQLRRK